MATVDRDEGVQDELKKLGLRIRRRVVEPRAQQPDKPGQIAFDDRGNAVYEWQEEHLTDDSAAGERAREKALALPGLAIVEDEGPRNSPMRNNTKGTRTGYNPYESGLLTKKQGPRKKVDLRELSKWMEAKKTARFDGQEE